MATPPVPSPADLRTILWCFFGFDGRLSRQSYLLAFLFVMIVTGFLLSGTIDQVEGQIQLTRFSVVLLLFSQGVVYALSVKRLHDLNASGWFALLLFVPMINLVAPLALVLLPGTRGPNRFGSRSDVRST